MFRNKLECFLIGVLQIFETRLGAYIQNEVPYEAPLGQTPAMPENIVCQILYHISLERLSLPVQSSSVLVSKEENAQSINHLFKDTLEHTNIHAFTSIHTHTQIDIYIYTQTHSQIYIYVCVCVCVCVSVCVWVCRKQIQSTPEKLL